MGGCGGNKPKSSGTKNSAPKNWGGMKAPKGYSSSTVGSKSGFGSPKVRTSFGKGRRSY